LSKKSSGTTNNASAVQFPIRLAFSATAHKIQGSTIKKPRKLVLDLRTVMEAAQAYVMLSRVQEMDQLIILETLPPKKIYASCDAMNELNSMKCKAINLKRTWNIVISCNIRSLPQNHKNFISTPGIMNSDVLCLQETWLHQQQIYDFKIDGFQVHPNSIGRGKGIVTYFKGAYSMKKDIKKEKYQMTKISSNIRDVVNVYRSQGANSVFFIEDLKTLFDRTKEVFIVGDFNICSKTQKLHYILQEIKELGFVNQVKYPTHIAGGYIDYVWVYFPYGNSDKSIEVFHQCPYFTDHDMLWVKEVREIAIF